MEKEISSGAMLGIVLIALAAIIGIGFGVFAIAKGTANTGVTNVQEKLEAVSQSEYTDYDQTIVTGTQVKSAYDNFAGKSSAILIATQALKDATVENSTTRSTCIAKGAAGIAKAYEKTAGEQNAEKNVPVVKVVGSKKSTGSTYNDIGWKNSKGKDVDGEIMINYNALLASSKGGSAVQGVASGDTLEFPVIEFDTNCYRTNNGYFTQSGKVQFNYISGNMSKSGMVEFLPTSARFQAYLIKDASGTTMGVAFEQISSK